MFFRKHRGHKFVAKADQDSYDFTKVDLDTDYTIHDLDVSGIVDKGAKAVVLWVAFRSPTVPAECRFSSKGYGGVYLKDLHVINVADVTKGFMTIVPLTNTGLFSYQIANETWTLININVVAWFV